MIVFTSGSSGLVGYDVRLTRGRSPVRFWAGVFIFFFIKKNKSKCLFLFKNKNL